MTATCFNYQSPQWRYLASLMRDEDHPLGQWALFIEHTGLPWHGVFPDEVEKEQENQETLKLFGRFCEYWGERA